ncbi:phage baseplate assembly protein [Acinetobacter venetianus]|uniref:phage baseplate assembly protein n=1 Tax=Acinetobacter venetianus TaxID=52133 RepID=UPI003A93C091
MSNEKQYGFYPAKIISYNRDKRRCMVHIEPFTRGNDSGIEAQIAYSVADDDYKTEVKLTENQEVWVFFEAGDLSRPVIAYSRCHGEGAEVGTRRIEQDKIELIANESIRLIVGEKEIVLTSLDAIFKVLTKIQDDLQVDKKVVAQEDVQAKNVSLVDHPHSGVMTGGGNTQKPMPTV